MTEEELLYKRVVAVAKEIDMMCGAIMEMAPTIELCVFTGKLSAVLDVLDALVQAGVPVPESDEEPHPLADKPS